MNKLFAFLLSLTLTILILSCKKEIDRVDPTPGIPTDTTTVPPVTGVVTPIGNPDGAVITATIGPAGGTLESADKRLMITIPAGALTSSQTFSVQPLSNNCPAGTGQAFRLTPHGLTFAKPAIITFQYDDQAINGSAPEMLRIAYQTDKGYWQSPAVNALDTAAHTVSVQTTHFSDWALFKAMYMYPEEALLNLGEHVHLKVLQTMEYPPVSTPAGDVSLSLPKLVDTKYINKWTLAGAGTLAHQVDEGDYYAPAKLPSTNPATVTVFLNLSVMIGGQLFKDLRLVANIYTIPEGVSVQEAGSDWQTYPGGATINSTQNIVSGRAGASTVAVGWKGQPTGTYRWTLNEDVSFHWGTGKFIYQNRYGNPVSISGGSLRVMSIDNEWIVGVFTLAPAGWINTALPITYGTTPVKGVFRVKRIN